MAEEDGQTIDFKRFVGNKPAEDFLEQIISLESDLKGKHKLAEDESIFDARRTEDIAQYVYGDKEGKGAQVEEDKRETVEASLMDDLGYIGQRNYEVLNDAIQTLVVMRNYGEPEDVVQRYIRVGLEEESYPSPDGRRRKIRSPKRRKEFFNFKDNPDGIGQIVYDALMEEYKSEEAQKAEEEEEEEEEVQEDTTTIVKERSGKNLLRAGVVAALLAGGATGAYMLSKNGDTKPQLSNGAPVAATTQDAGVTADAGSAYVDAVQAGADAAAQAVADVGPAPAADTGKTIDIYVAAKPDVQPGIIPVMPVPGKDAGVTIADAAVSLDAKVADAVSVADVGPIPVDVIVTPKDVYKPKKAKKPKVVKKKPAKKEKVLMPGPLVPSGYEPAKAGLGDYYPRLVREAEKPDNLRQIVVDFINAQPERVVFDYSRSKERLSYDAACDKLLNDVFDRMAPPPKASDITGTIVYYGTKAAFIGNARNICGDNKAALKTAWKRPPKIILTPVNYKTRRK